MEIFSKLFRKNRDLPPAPVSDSFGRYFPDAVNIEWSRQGDLYEALFFGNQAETSATFDPNGNLLEYRVNINPIDVPPFISDAIGNDLQIMNCIEVHREGSFHYELIVRDKTLKRYLLNLQADGVILSHETL